MMKDGNESQQSLKHGTTNNLQRREDEGLTACFPECVNGQVTELSSDTLTSATSPSAGHCPRHPNYEVRQGV